VLVISTTCAVLYAALWGIGLLQTNGLIATGLPIPVADAVILRRSGAQLRPASLASNEAAVRDQALANAQQAPGAGPGPAADAAQSPVTLELQAPAPVHLWVLDSAGHATGTNPETGLVQLQLDGSRYSGKGSDPELVSIPNAAGVYRVQLGAERYGQFELRVRAFVGDDVEHARVYAGSGEIFPNSLLETQATISFEDSAGQAQLAVAPVQVVLASPDAPASPSPAPAPESSAESLVAGVQASPDASAAGVAAPPAPPPARAPAAAPSQSPPAVFRPQPVANLPIPLPLPQLPPPPVVDNHD
jgi:hypothetical protein